MTEDYDMNIHTNPDALAWGKFFCETIKNNPQIELDEDYMTAWFANAMMAMHDYLIYKGNPINGDHAEFMMNNKNGE